VHPEEVGVVFAPPGVLVGCLPTSLPIRLSVAHESEEILTAKNLRGVTYVIAAIEGSIEGQGAVARVSAAGRNIPAPVRRYHPQTKRHVTVLSVNDAELKNSPAPFADRLNPCAFAHNEISARRHFVRRRASSEAKLCISVGTRNNEF
jgi:hypothetical protein